MSFYVQDFSDELRDGLESILGFKGFSVWDDCDMHSVRCVVADPMLIKRCGEDALEYMDSFNLLIRVSIPVVFYSEQTEENLIKMGFEKGVHYSKYFNKNENYLNEVAGYMRMYLEDSPLDRRS